MATIPREDLLPGERQPRLPPPPPPPPATNKQQAERDMDRRYAPPPPVPTPTQVFGPKVPPRETGDLAIGGRSSRGERPPMALGLNPGPIVARPGTTGANRFLSEVTQTHYALQSRDYDSWILARPYDPTDPEYNAVLFKQKQAALERQKKRGYRRDQVLDTPSWLEQQLRQQGVWGGAAEPQATNFRAADRDMGMGAPAAPALDARAGADDDRDFFKWVGRERESERQTRRWTSQPQFVDKNGNIIVSPDTRLPKKELDPNNPEFEPGGDEFGSPMERVEFLASGGGVYMGEKEVTLANGKKIKVPVYRNTAEMINDIAGMSVDERKAFQRSIGLPETGVADAKTVKSWQTLVMTAAYHTAYGQNYDVNWLKQQLFGKHGGRGGGRGGGGGGRRRGGGGGGGGSGGAKISRDQAIGLLNPTMQKYTGREATPEEITAFMSAAQAAFNADPEGFSADVFTANWVKARVPGQVGAYQAATNYYEAIQSVLAGGVS